MKQLLENRAKFLAFLRSRVESDDAAEELLQAAYAKGLERAGSLRDREKVTAWFYRLLRNALVDHYRRRAARDKALGVLKNAPAAEDPRLERAVCRCVHDAIGGLKPVDAALLRKVELEDAPLKSAAKELGLTPNNAAVRLHRARRTLKRSLLQTCGACAAHGCLDCSCRKA